MTTKKGLQCFKFKLNFSLQLPPKKVEPSNSDSNKNIWSPLKLKDRKNENEVSKLKSFLYKPVDLTHKINVKVISNKSTGMKQLSIVSFMKKNVKSNSGKVLIAELSFIFCSIDNF